MGRRVPQKHGPGNLLGEEREVVLLNHVGSLSVLQQSGRLFFSRTVEENRRVEKKHCERETAREETRVWNVHQKHALQSVR